jgi:subtilisin family serine protease
MWPVETVHIALDHALPLHQVPAAWSRIGGFEKAGLGMKIAILDTGISPDHAAFQDSTLKPPPGYPIVSGPENQSVVNHKIIVARNYAALYQLTEPDSARDRSGHGTSTADCAAGMPAAGPWGTVTGVAPKAFLGVYKITALTSGSANTDVIAQAFDDALADSMDVINLSFASPAEYASQSLMHEVIDRITHLGVIVVVAAGNDGPTPASVGDIASAPSAISVGASQNDRYFGGMVALPGSDPIPGLSFSYGQPVKPVTAPLKYLPATPPAAACGPFPEGSLTGQIALVEFATLPSCTPEDGLNAYAKAGAVGTIGYVGLPGAPAVGGASAGQATLPSLSISNKDGLALKAAAQSGNAVVSMTPEGIFYPQEARAIASGSSRGPTGSYALKPDLAATGISVYMATQSLDPTGALFNGGGYTQAQGTSFASPIVAGAATVVKMARPGLTIDQYRSLLINSVAPLNLPDGTVEHTQTTGAGILNLDAALTSSITVYPTSLSQGIGGSTLNTADYVTLTNVGTSTETFSVSAAPYDGTPAPTFATDSSSVVGITPGKRTLEVTLAPQQSTTLDFVWQAPNLGPGEYQGLIRISGAKTGSLAWVPYWYGVSDGVARYSTFMSASTPTQARAGSQVPIFFKVVDGIGAAITDPTALNVKRTVISGGGSISGPVPSSYYLHAVYLTATLSNTPR